MNYEECLRNCIELNSNNKTSLTCECVNTSLIEFFNYYPWYFYLSIAILLGFTIGIIYIIIMEISKNEKQKI